MCRTRSARYWMGPVGEKDDFGDTITDTFIDGATARGPWAIMTRKSMDLHGLGVGPGVGQQYKKQENGRWLKVGG